MKIHIEKKNNDEIKVKTNLQINVLKATMIKITR